MRQITLEDAIRELKQEKDPEKRRTMKLMLYPILYGRRVTFDELIKVES